MQRVVGEFFSCGLQLLLEVTFIVDIMTINGFH